MDSGNEDIFLGEGDGIVGVEGENAAVFDEKGHYNLRGKSR